MCEVHVGVMCEACVWFGRECASSLCSGGVFVGVCGEGGVWAEHAVSAE